MTTETTDWMAKTEARRAYGDKGTSQFYADIRAGIVPRPVKIGRASRWLRSEYEEWKRRVIAERDGSVQ